MSDREKLHQPEINKEEAVEMVNNLAFEDYEHFTYQGEAFLLLLSTQEEVDAGESHEEAFFTTSTLIDGYDIYLLESLPLEMKKRMVFHEIVEAHLRTQGFDTDTAHNLAKQTEVEVFGSRDPSSDKGVTDEGKER